MAQEQYDEDRAMVCQEQQTSGQPSQDNINSGTSYQR